MFVHSFFSKLIRTFLLSVCTLFIGTYMTRAAIDPDAKWIVLVFIFVHIAAEITLSVIGYLHGEENGEPTLHDM